MVNQVLAQEILDKITAHPDQHRQGMWASKSNDTECGTSCCIAGWACVLSGEELDWYQALNGPWFADHTVSGEHIADAAERLLGLPKHDGDYIFYAEQDRARELVAALAEGGTFHRMERQHA